MSDEKTPTLPPPPIDAGEAAFTRMDTKLDRLLVHVERLTILAEDVFAAVQEDRLERQKMKDDIAALQRIPPRPEANGADAS